MKGNRRRTRGWCIDGRSKHPLHGIWAGMISRCHNPGFEGYRRYGAKGISVCKEWRDSFWEFAGYIGERPTPRHSIDRWPNQKGNYEPGNVRWATPEEQSRNRMANRRIEYHGQVRTVAEWSAIHGLPTSTIHNRLSRGMSPSDAVSLPSTYKASRGIMRRCAEANMSWDAVHGRILKGMTLEEATDPLAFPVKRNARGGIVASS